MRDSTQFFGLFIVLVAALLVAGPWGLSPAVAGPDGKQVFLDYKCQNCHSIKAIGIEVDESAEEEMEEGEEPPDLSDTGKEHEKMWFAKYLLKRVELEGKKHRKGFRGEKPELAAIASWLATLKHSKP